MKIRDFGLEIFFGRYEFSAPYLLAQSDCAPNLGCLALKVSPEAKKNSGIK